MPKATAGEQTEISSTEQELLSLHLELSKVELARLQPALRRLRRDRHIRREYKALLPEMGQLAALWEVGEQHGLSKRQIERIVYGQK